MAGPVRARSWLKGNSSSKPEREYRPRPEVAGAGMEETTRSAETHSEAEPRAFRRELSLWDSTAIVAGTMIGSGVFIVPAEMARLVGAAGWLLLAWAVTGLVMVAAALSYGELAAMFPKAGGDYNFLRAAYSPLAGFLFGWTLFLVIRCGSIAAVAVGFSRFLGVFFPAVSAERFLIPPVDLSSGYAISLSTQQLVAILLIAALTAINTRGIRLGKLIQNVFTSTKTLALVALIAVGLIAGWNSEVVARNFAAPWTPVATEAVRPELPFLPEVAASGGLFALLIAFCVAQVGSLFSADGWSNIGYAAGEIKHPKRDLPLSLAIGVTAVVGLYVLANLAYLVTLPLAEIQHAPDDRVASAALQAIFGPAGTGIMALLILISAFGCNNGLILGGARVYYAMARDGLFFAAAGRLNRHHVPAAGLALQGIWAAFLVLPRTRALDAAGAVRYGNLYGNLLEYVMFAVLVFYCLSVAGVFILRRKLPAAERPYRAFGYPFVPLFFLAAAAVILAVLALYRTQTTWPGIAIVLTGIPVYFLWRRNARSAEASG